MRVFLMSSALAGIFNFGLISVTYADAGKIGTASGITGVKQINGEDVVKLADYDEDMVTFDSRSTAQRKQGSLSWSEAFNAKTLTSKLLADKVFEKTTIIVFYGEVNSQKAAQGATFAVKNGYKNVYWFKGGWNEWKQKKLSLK